MRSACFAFFDRNYSSQPSPLWSSTVPISSEGEKHPADRAHTDRLFRLQQAIQTSVSRRLRADGGPPILRTEVSPDKAQQLRELHRLCDWVITLDRNAGMEYFDSPKHDKETHDAYVIDCVPERQDLGCLQLITSTSNLEEVRNLLDTALDQMGLSRSRRNAEFLMWHLKALSGRFASRATFVEILRNDPKPDPGLRTLTRGREWRGGVLRETRPSGARHGRSACSIGRGTRAPVRRGSSAVSGMPDTYAQYASARRILPMPSNNLSSIARCHVECSHQCPARMLVLIGEIGI